MRKILAEHQLLAVSFAALIGGFAAFGLMTLSSASRSQQVPGTAIVTAPITPPPRNGVWKPTAAELKAATCRGMTWVVLKQEHELASVGSDRKLTDAYRGDTSCDTELPILCVKKEHLAKPAGVAADFYNGWLGGSVSVTEPIEGLKLESRAAGDGFCAKAHGVGWVMAEHHDGGGGWGFTGYGTLPDTRFWVAIDNQPANPWNSR